MKIFDVDGDFVLCRFQRLPRQLKNANMNRTSNTSARITTATPKTTDRVVERPTPSVPPLVRMPSKTGDHADDQSVDRGLQRRRQKVAEVDVPKPILKKQSHGDRLLQSFATHPIKIPKTSAAKVSSGSIRMQANTRVATKYRNGSTPDASMASICSVTFIEPEFGADARSHAAAHLPSR
ncbi:MAG: hypothetical protein WDO73_23055 [Ignavibacteriota bacterium]